MFGTTMPETPVHKDGDTRTREDDIHAPPAQSRNRTIDPESQAATVEQRAQTDLGPSVSAPHPTEVCADLRGGWWWTVGHAPRTMQCTAVPWPR
jgi:hypothetical protein